MNSAGDPSGPPRRKTATGARSPVYGAVPADWKAGGRCEVPSRLAGSYDGKGYFGSWNVDSFERVDVDLVRTMEIKEEDAE